MSLKIRLQTKILIPILMVVILSVSATSIVYLNSQIDTVDTYFQNLLKRTSELYEIGLVLALWNGNFEDAELTFNKLKSDPFVDYVQIFDEEQDEICNLGTSIIDAKEVPSIKENTVLERGDYLIYVTSIKYNNKEYLGKLFLGIDKNKKDALITDLILKTLFLALIILTLSIIGIRYIISYIIERPIQNFMKSMTRISTGHLDFELQLDSTDEFHDLGVSFNLMLKELKKTRTKLQNSNETLEEAKMDLIKDLVEKILYEKELIASKEAAVKANEDKGAMLRHITHELRTPMNSILGFSKKLLEAENNKKLIQDYSQIIHVNSKRLLTLINDILDFSRLNVLEKITPNEKVNLDVINEIIQSFSPLLEKNNIKLEYKIESTVPDVIETNKKMFVQILVNLIGNAIKFTKKGLVLVTVTNKDASHITISVKDTGVGIGEEHLSHIFDEFYQVSGEHQSEKGTGLGLNITKRLVEKLKGGISVESVVGEGTEFTFYIRNHDPLIDISTTYSKKEHGDLKLSENEIESLKELSLIQFFRKSDIHEGVKKLYNTENEILKSKLEELNLYIKNHQKDEFYLALNEMIQTVEIN